MGYWSLVLSLLNNNLDRIRFGVSDLASVLAAPVTHNLGVSMNIELEEVVGQDVSDDALELAAGGAQGGQTRHFGCGSQNVCL